MKCRKIIDIIYEMDDAPFLDRALAAAHLLFCESCSAEARRLREGMDAMGEASFPPAPSAIEDSVMALIAEEEGAFEPADFAAPGGFSFKGWIAAGVVMLVSLATIFFGMEFSNVARAAGMSFMIPIGITIGILLTVYGALFIGSHLKKLSQRFGLES
ncbi:MAG: peptidoglycan-binding protein [Treponema sp.]|nr:peptidoglycan-binding protein [Treponema sp.]